MVDGIGSAGGSGRIEGTRPTGTSRAGSAKAATVRTAAEAEDSGKVGTPASEMAQLGPPYDAAKVDDLRARIAAGTYRVDPQAVAAKMMALDLPEKK